MTIRAAMLSGLFLFAAGGLRADQVEMQNGDRYAGKVIAMSAETVVLQSDVLGKLTLPRSKVASISLGANAVASAARPPAAHSTNQARGASILVTNTSPDIAEALHNLGANTNFIEQVRRQFLSDAGPAANNKYDELVAGLFSGKFDINSLRAEAKAAADQIRALKSQGGDVGPEFDSYLTILDNFLRQSTPPAQATASAPPLTNSPQPITIISR
jgi:hypothetical protein